MEIKFEKGEISTDKLQLISDLSKKGKIAYIQIETRKLKRNFYIIIGILAILILGFLFWISHVR